jgi:NADH:ubiquinone oxidoreductase subunit 2 (subunit N)
VPSSSHPRFAAARWDPIARPSSASSAPTPSRPFAKILIYVAAAAALIVAPDLFRAVRAMRAEYPLLILFAALGGSIMVSASDLLTLYIGSR